MWAALLLLALGSGFPYRQALPGYRYSFPRDHFEHPDFRTEWWYYTGNVHTPQGRRYGFELVFFRQAQRRGPSGNASSWRVDDLYLAHLALTDIDGQRFRYSERLNRAGPGVAGASFARRRIWNGNWSAQWEGDAQTLDAVAEDFRFHLRLTPRKPPVIHGENGVSQKAGGPGRASCYVSFPRLAVEGEIDEQPVAGTAWMDHEWFTHQLEADQVGWDWFSVQLADGADCMLFQLRRRDGSIDPYSSGTYIDPQGRARHLKKAEFSLQPLAWWTSPRTGARYPVRWRIQAPSLHVTLTCVAAIPQQELVARENAGPSYWEGAVTYSGSAQGVGYLEMTGYGKPVSLE
ncbi:MAG TPA: lipocalin-like domain-containing protein [Bryobacteraceae bacterium]|nr:lipocalin-like domain-containing protein [Bryobacteraceae bacterium]